MKVITEERLRELLLEVSQLHGTEYSTIEKLIINECKEVDTLTVTRLRPMCEAKDNVLILCALIEEKSFLPGRLHGDNFVGMNGFVIGKSEIPGFIPMPRHEPEKV